MSERHTDDNWWVLPSPNNSPALVRFAIEARLGQFDGVPGMSGREHYRRTENLKSLGAITGRLQSKNIPAAVSDLERNGVAEPSSVSRFALRLGFDLSRHGIGDIGPNWWSRLSQDLVRGEGHEFRSAAEIVLLGHALVAHLRHVSGAKAQPLFKSAQGHETEVDIVLEALIRVACGPFGFADEAIGILTNLAPVSHPNVVRAIQDSPMGGKLVRVLDRAVRLGIGGSRVRRAFDQLMDKPPESIMFRLIWLRGLRRTLWSAQRRDGAEEHRWVRKQLLLFALHNDGAYRWATPADRRYAMWILVEFAPDSGDYCWGDVLDVAAEAPELASLVPDAEEARRYLSKVGGAPDLVNFAPGQGWQATEALASCLSERCDPSRLRKERREIWHPWANPKVKASIGGLTTEMLTTPCAIRLRTSADAVIAAGPRAQDATSQLIAEVLRSGLERGLEDFEIERCLYLLGYLRSPLAVEPIESLLHNGSDLSEPVLRTAVIAAANLADRHPAESAGLVAWAKRRVPSTDSEAMIAAGMFLSITAQESWWRDLPTTGWTSSSMAGWCEQMEVDPLRRKFGEDH